MSYEIPTTGAIVIKPGADSTAAILLKSSGGTDIFRLDSTNSRVGIGNTATAPGATLVVSNNATVPSPVVSNGMHIIGADAANVRIQMNTFGSGTSPGIFGTVAFGTSTSPAATQAQGLCQFGGRGYLATAYSNILGAMLISAEETFTDSTAKTGIAFSTTPAGSVTAVETMRLDGAGHLGLGTAAPAVSAAIDITSTTSALLLSRMTTAQRDALTAANGMIIYNTTTTTIQGYQAGAWANL